MTEKGGIFKNWQTQKGLLESKLHKNILVDCVLINSMLKMTLIINYAEQFKANSYLTLLLYTEVPVQAKKVSGHVYEC